MEIAELLKLKNAKISIEDKWLYWDEIHNVWVVRENKRRIFEIILLATESIDEALTALIKLKYPDTTITVNS